VDFTPSGAECDNDGIVSHDSCTNNTPRTSGIEAIKQGVSIEDVAREHGEFKQAGAGGLLGRCVSPDHEDRTPSLTVWTETGTFRCFGCQAHGDVIDLEGLAGRHADTWTAMVALSERYGVGLPRRSETWHRWQSEKLSIEAVAERTRFEVRCRRLFKLMILNAPEIQKIADPSERRAEIALCWESFRVGMREVRR
jgi:hypothetical protein